MLSRPPAGTIPDAPGSYQFKDAQGRVIYVGKARSLRQRLSNYFQNPAQLHPRTAQMVATAASVEWIQVRNEVEALMLEFSLIKEHRPRFNVRLVDDKSYPYLAVTVADEWPRPMVMRGAKRKGVRYFGPYAHAYAIRETLDLLLRTFPLRTCTDAKFGRHHRMGRPCLLYHIEKCSGPCVGEVDDVTYAGYVEDLLEFLDGDTDAVVARLDRQMREAASALEYERAARVRDRLASVRKAIEKQQIVGDRSEDVDVVGVAEDDLEAAVQVFFVRRGRVVGRRGFVVDKVEALDRPHLVGNILEGLYYDEPAAGYPKSVLVCDLPDDPDLYETWLSEQRANSAAAEGRHLTGHVQVRVPQRGDKRELLATVTRNAEEEFVRHRLRRASDINARSKALEELQDALGLPMAPLRIECYDNSHLGGTDYVSSMVVFEDGLPAKGQYRRFRLRHVPGNDDFAAMEEVLTRRLRNYLEDRDKPVAERGRFQYPPQLLMVDGGKGQLGVAIRVLDDLGLAEEIPVCALAKEFEEVYLPGQSDPVRLPRQSEALYLLQRLRDESHRFAITYQRQLRNKRMTKGFLDDVPGLGPTRRKRLIRELGGVTAVRRASSEQLKSLRWLPDAVADAIVAKNTAAAAGAGRDRGVGAGPGTGRSGDAAFGPTGEPDRAMPFGATTDDGSLDLADLDDEDRAGDADGLDDADELDDADDTDDAGGLDDASKFDDADGLDDASGLDDADDNDDAADTDDNAGGFDADERDRGGPFVGAGQRDARRDAGDPKRAAGVGRPAAVSVRTGTGRR
jgi:excinuclease ABC subunit C